MFDGRFFPPDVVEWMKTLPFFYEDEHAIYVHAGIKRDGGGFPHPSDVEPKRALLWLRDRDFFENYRGKLVVFGHTTTRTLPQRAVDATRPTIRRTCGQVPRASVSTPRAARAAS